MKHTLHKKCHRNINKKRNIRRKDGINSKTGEAFPPNSTTNLDSHKDDFDKLKNKFPWHLAFSTKLLTRVHEEILEASSEPIGLTDHHSQCINTVTHATCVTENIH